VFSLTDPTDVVGPVPDRPFAGPDHGATHMSATSHVEDRPASLSVPFHRRAASSMADLRRGSLIAARTGTAGPTACRSTGRWRDAGRYAGIRGLRGGPVPR
jgi:hypothetical protein